jgi:transcriptional regulator with XRE-family HTH domain
MTLDLPIGERIRSCRHQRGMSQTVLAGLVGRSERWMVEVEGGAADLRVSDLVQIARALDIDPADLLTGKVPSPPESAAMVRRSQAEAARIERLGTRWGTVVGDVWFPWVVASYGPYRHEHIESHFHAEEPAYPPEVDETFQALRQDLIRRAAVGDDVPYESDDFKLLR